MCESTSTFADTVKPRTLAEATSKVVLLDITRGILGWGNALLLQCVIVKYEVHNKQVTNLSNSIILLYLAVHTVVR